MSNDVLILLDTCYSGATVALVDPTKSQGRAEIITACGYSETARAPNGVETQAMLHNPTFTRSLISVLKQKANANSPMTATSSHLAIVQDIIDGNYTMGNKGIDVLPTAVHYSIGND